MSARRPSLRPWRWQVRGERNASAKLTARDVAWARRVVGHSVSLTTAADMLGVSKPTLWDAVHGFTWSHLRRHR